MHNLENTLKQWVCDFWPWELGQETNTEDLSMLWEFGFVYLTRGVHTVHMFVCCAKKMFKYARAVLFYFCHLILKRERLRMCGV